MKVAVIGAGYVGLTTAACFAHLGHDVTCADIDAERVARCRRARSPILEAGLPELLARGARVAAGCGSSSARRPPRATPTSCSCACRHRRATTAAADLSYVETVAREIAPVLGPNTVVVNKSTVPVGSTRFVQRVLSESRRRQRGHHRRVESRVPARGPGCARLPQSRSHRDRLRPSRVGGAGERALQGRARAGARHRPRVGRDDQVRVERVPRDEGVVHQRDREPVRDRRRRRARGRDRHGLRRADRLSVPAPRSRATAVRASRRTSPRCSTRRAQSGYDFELLAGVVEVNRAQHERIVDKVRDAAGGELGRRRSSARGASRSRPTPTTCATRPRS